MANVGKNDSEPRATYYKSSAAQSQPHVNHINIKKKPTIPRGFHKHGRFSIL